MAGFWLTEEQEAIREGVARLCADFDADYWRRTDETGEFPEASSRPWPRRLAGRGHARKLGGSGPGPDRGGGR
jgi:acyl-CoA dehydrogenase